MARNAASVTHFSEHTGQIPPLTKAYTGEDLGFYAHLANPAHGQTTPRRPDWLTAVRGNGWGKFPRAGPA